MTLPSRYTKYVNSENKIYFNGNVLSSSHLMRAVFNFFCYNNIITANLFLKFITEIRFCLFSNCRIWNHCSHKDFPLIENKLRQHIVLLSIDRINYIVNLKNETFGYSYGIDISLSLTHKSPYCFISKVTR